MTTERMDTAGMAVRPAGTKPGAGQNTAAHEKFWEEHHRLVEAYCRRMLPHDDWESAAQEVFVKAFHNWETVRQVVSPSAWLATVSRRHCLNILRATREAPIPFDELAERYQTDPESPYAGVESRIAHTQLLEEIKRRAALWKPPWDAVDWRIFEAFYNGEKRTAKEVAAILGLDFDRVRYRFNHHIRPLFKAIEPV